MAQPPKSPAWDLPEDTEKDKDKESKGHDRSLSMPITKEHIRPPNDNKQWEKGSDSSKLFEKGPLFDNCKEEVFNNEYATISKYSWNHLLTKVNDMFKGASFDQRKQMYFRKLINNHKIQRKDLLVLKLYADYGQLQREYRKCFRESTEKPDDADQKAKADKPDDSTSDDDNEDSKIPPREKHCRSFAHWHRCLGETFAKLDQIKTEKKFEYLFHGVSCGTNIDQFKGKYYGPLSTTTNLGIARQFAGKKGLILVIKPDYDIDNSHNPFDISYISDFPEEHEVLCFDVKYTITNVIHSSEYDKCRDELEGIFYKKDLNLATAASHGPNKLVLRSPSKLEISRSDMTAISVDFETREKWIAKLHLLKELLSLTEEDVEQTNGNNGNDEKAVADDGGDNYDDDNVHNNNDDESKKEPQTIESIIDEFKTYVDDIVDPPSVFHIFVCSNLRHVYRQSKEDVKLKELCELIVQRFGDYLY